MMIQTSVTLFFLLILQSTLWSQDNLWNNRENILLNYENYPDTNFAYIIEDNTNEILVKIYGEDSLEITHYIQPYSNGEVDNESICDSIVIELLCLSCAEFHITQMSNSKKRKWSKLSDSLYVSSKYVSKFYPADKTPNSYTIPVMKILNESKMPQIILYSVELTKKQWKELEKGVVAHINYAALPE